MNGCFSFCLTSLIFDIFSKTEQYFLLLDKLSPDSVMASSRSEENVVLNNFQHKKVYQCWYTLMIFIGYIDIILSILADIMPFFVVLNSLTDVIIKVCVNCFTTLGRCYCHM